MSPTKLYYEPGNPATLDYPVRPLRWFLFARHKRRWAVLGVIIAALALLWFGVLPIWVWWPYQVAVWSFNIWQGMDMLYDRADHKRKMLQLARRHEARMARYARQDGKIIATHAAPLREDWERRMALFREGLK